MVNKQFFIIDFDSTFIQSESLEELAAVALKKHPQRDKILDKMQAITTQGMEGKMPFDESLRLRLAILEANKEHIEKTLKLLKKKITPSMFRNKAFFKQFASQIYIISGGFKDIILPIVTSFGINESHVLANDFVFDEKGNIIGIDYDNVLSQAGGKAKAVARLGLQGEIFVIGDGNTDWEIAESLRSSVVRRQQLVFSLQPRVTSKKFAEDKRLQTVDYTVRFVAFTENVFREVVAKKADYVVPNLDEFLYTYHLPLSVSYPKNRLFVLLLENINQTAITAFEKEGFAVEYYEKSPARDDLMKKISEVSVLGIRSRTQLDRELLQRAKKLLAVGAFCIGTEQIDLLASQEKGIAVYNAPFSNTRSVVELVVGEMIMLARGAYQKSIKLHQGVWDKSARGSVELREKTLGIIGYGNIGSQLSVLAEALGMNVVFYNTSEKLALGTAKAAQSMAEVLIVADFISIHVSAKPGNKNLIGKKEFQQMKDGVFFLNLSRGFVVDIPSFVEALKNGKVAGAAVDVYPEEPKSAADPFVSDLQAFDNVILTPHIGGSTKEAQEHIGRFVANRLIEYINTGNTLLSLTLPQISLPQVKGAHRLLHVHKNVSGILAQINTVLAQNHCNILAQQLKTNESIGYVITDIDREHDEKVHLELKAIPGTIRMRILY